MSTMFVERTVAAAVGVKPRAAALARAVSVSGGDFFKAPPEAAVGAVGAGQDVAAFLRERSSRGDDVGGAVGAAGSGTASVAVLPIGAKSTRDADTVDAVVRSVRALWSPGDVSVAKARALEAHSMRMYPSRAGVFDCTSLADVVFRAVEGVMYIVAVSFVPLRGEGAARGAVHILSAGDASKPACAMIDATIVGQDHRPRLFKAATYSVARMHGMAACAFASCIMNPTGYCGKAGSPSHVDDAASSALDDTPAYFCPVCTRKLSLAIPSFNVVDSFTSVGRLVGELGMREAYCWYDERLAVITQTFDSSVLGPLPGQEEDTGSPVPGHVAASSRPELPGARGGAGRAGVERTLPSHSHPERGLPVVAGAPAEVDPSKLRLLKRKMSSKRNSGGRPAR